MNNCAMIDRLQLSKDAVSNTTLQGARSLTRRERLRHHDACDLRLAADEVISLEELRVPGVSENHSKYPPPTTTADVPAAFWLANALLQVPETDQAMALSMLRAIF